MLRKISSLIIFMFIIILLVLTNPTKGEYSAWLLKQYTQQSTSSSSIGTAIASLIGEPLIESATKSNNLIIFSIYDTKPGNKSVTTVDLLKNFIVISKDQYIEYAYVTCVESLHEGHL